MGMPIPTILRIPIAEILPRRAREVAGAAAAANAGPFNSNSVFGHVHPGPAEWWIVQSGQVTGRFENTGEFVGGEGASSTPRP